MSYTNELKITEFRINSACDLNFLVPVIKFTIDYFKKFVGFNKVTTSVNVHKAVCGGMPFYKFIY